MFMCHHTLDIVRIWRITLVWARTMKKLLLVMFLMPTFAMAQQPEKEFTLKVTNADINAIGKGLEGLPYRDVAQLMQKLQQQLVAQQQAEQPKSPLPTNNEKEPNK